MDRSRSETEIDETLAASFPASDPPSWTLGKEIAHSDDPAKIVTETEAVRSRPPAKKSR